jgi:hypothetical protein
MSYTQKVSCERCGGTGIEPVFPTLGGQQDPDLHLVCSGCMGQCHVSRNPDAQPARFNDAD